MQTLRSGLKQCLVSVSLTIEQFPYALQALPSALRNDWDKQPFSDHVLAFPAEYRTSPEVLENHVQDLMARDVKVSYLKNLQGYLWLSGYESGALRCPLFKDVAPAMQLWHGQGIQLIIYSSGSVAAQKLLFQYTNHEPADLRPLISDYFDTTNAGLKQESNSYLKIASAHPQHEANTWLFLSDNVKEVDAARQAGMQAAVVVRPGNAELSADESARNTVVDDFLAIVQR